ncbi:HTH_48 domain-containing protein [Nephila pilipes]|uniref:HTH_48 domain-containing protein n=1 Tax=Nephila pilipes TaxID=299642 RepID=A0A8X6ND21_NEPPI|nr:HTH_48 domain-containing protein [Nephila pilipes]
MVSFISSPCPGKLSATLILIDGAATSFSRQIRITLCDSFFVCKKHCAGRHSFSTVCSLKKKCMNIQHVRKWYREYKDGHTDVHDEQRSRKPSISDEMIVKVQEALLNDRGVMVRDNCKMISDIRKSCIYKIWTDHLGYA